MPHYKNGMEAKVGDLVFGVDINGKRFAGRVDHIFLGADRVNARVASVEMEPVLSWTEATLSEVNSVSFPPVAMAADFADLVEATPQ